MKLPTNLKKFTVSIISYLFMLLFVYAAVSKLTDFHNFRIQVAQSPLLTAFAGFISIAVVTAELIISVLLSFSRSRLIGLYSSLALMIMFTVYIFLILNYSPYVPCSCGGILEEMGWAEHLYFNIAFVFLAIAAIYIIENQKKARVARFSKRIAANIISSVLLIVILFLQSENIIHKNNNFVRRFPPFPAKRAIVNDLKFTSYYFAGANNSYIYLGNYTAPGLMTMVDSGLQKITPIRLNVNDTMFKFRNVQLRVIPPHFFIYDGTVPCVFTGKLTDRNAVLFPGEIPGFTKATIVDSSTIIARTLNPFREHRLTKLHFNRNTKNILSDSLLQKQADGFFDTDGELLYDSHLKRMVYTYYYRNQYIVADDALNLIGRGNTIDTTFKANIKTEYVGPRKIKKFSAPPLMVNRVSALYRNLLFINSTLPGRYESAKMWKDASVIDVYDITTRSYVMSFYVYKVDGGRPDFMIATDNHLFVLIGSKIISYRFGKELKDKFR